MLKTRLLILMLACVLASATAHAASGTLYWDSDATSSGNSNASGLNLGGTGTWDNATTPNWWNGSGADTTWTNANNDTALFWGTAGTVTLGTGITAGGLTFNTTGYILDASTNTLTFGATNNTIALNNIAAATLTGGVAGSGNVTLSGGIYGGSTAGTLTLNGTSAGGWSGTTTIGNNMTMSLSGANQALVSTTGGITLNSGGVITLVADATTPLLDRVKDTAKITVNGGGKITYTTGAAADGVTYAETLGTVALTSGELTVSHSVNKTTSGSQTLTLSDVTQAGAATVLFGSGTAPLGTAFNIITVTTAVGHATTSGEVIGPWATTVGSSSSYKYVAYDAFGRVIAATLTATTEAGLTNATKAYILAANETLTANRTAMLVVNNSLAGSITLDVANYDLRINGWGTLKKSSPMTITNSGSGHLTTPDNGGNQGYLFFTPFSETVTVNAPIIDNNGSVTVVKGSGIGTLILDNSTGNFSGGVVLNSGLMTISGTTTNFSGGVTINGGTLTIGNDANLGTNGGVTFGGSGALTASGVTIGSGRTITLTNGALATLSSTAIINGLVTGNGGITVAGSLTLANTGNDFTGPIFGTAAGTLSLASLSDAAGAGVISLGSAATAVTFQWTGAAKTLSNRQFVLPGTTGAIKISNNSTTGALTINTDPGVTGLGSKTLTLGGTYTGGANTFAGRMADPAGFVLSLTTADAGTWVLSGANSYSGLTTVSSPATLQLGHPTALGTTAGSTTVASGGTLDLNGQTIGAEPLTIAGVGVVASGSPGALVNNSATPASCSGAITQSAASTLGGTGDMVLSGAVGSSTFALTKKGTGTVTLSGTGSYTGATTVNGGTLLLDMTGSGALASTSPLTLGGGNFSVKGNGTASSVTAQTLGALTLTASTGSAITLDPNNSGASGSTTLTLGNAWTRNANSSLLIDYSSSNTGTRQVVTAAATTGYALSNGIYGAIMVKDIAGITGFATRAAGINIPITRFDDRDTGSGGLGTTLVNNSNTATTNFTSLNTVYTSGTLSWSNGITTRSVNSLTIDTTNNGGTIDMGAAANILTLTSLGILFKGASNEILQGGQVGAANSEVIVHQTGAGTLTINSLISSGTGKLTKDGTGTLVLGASSTYTGATVINAGILKLGAAGDATNTPLGTTGTGTTVSTGAALDLGGFTLGTAEALTLNGTGISSGGALLNSGSAATYSGLITLGSNASIVANNNITLSAAGTITGSGFGLTLDGTSTGSSLASIIGTGAGTVTKVGTGTWTFSGANTYTGATTVSAGTLAGTGSITSNLVVNGGAVAPGIPGGTTGTFTAKNADFSNGGTLKIRLVDLTHFDVLALTDTTSTTSLKMGGSSVLQIDLSGLTVTNTEFVIATATTWSTGPGNGFATVQFLPSNTANARVSYKGTSGTGVEVRVALGTQGVTPVKIADFAAKSEGAGVNVSWTCVSEYQNAGFNIYRRAVERSEWVKVNPALIAGRITNPDEKKYAYFDWASAGIYEYKLESVDLSGVREEHSKLSDVVEVDWMLKPLNVSVGVIDSAIRSIDMEVSALTAQRVETIFASTRTRDVSTTPAVAQKTNASAKVTVRAFDARANSDVSAANDVVERSVASAAKVQMPTVGVRWFSSGHIATSFNFTAAKVTYKNAGVMLIPQSSMPDGFDLGNVALQREGRNMNALARVSGGLLVYAPGYKDDYTDKDAIFLRKTANATTAGTPSTAAGLFSSSMPVNVTSVSSITNEYHDVYFDYGFRPYSFEPWFSAKYLTQGSTQDFTVSLPNAVNSAANLVVNVWSLTSSESVTPDHGIQVLVNGQTIGEASWDGGGKMLQMAFTIPAGALNSGDNTVSLITPTISGQDSQIALLHSISVSYTRALDGSRPIEITNTSNTASQYEFFNVPNGGAWVVDARFTDRASLIPAETLLQADGTLRLRFVAAAGGSGKFIVVPVGQENKPLVVSVRQVKPLRLNGTYLATGPAQFASGVQPLLAKRSKEGIRSVFVDQEQLFDYYNYGRFGPEGIRKAVRSVRPSYLLLVGRTTYDYLNYGGANVDPLCPAFLVSTNFWAQTTSDSAFGDIGRGYPEVAIGRLPVNNTSELACAVNHIVNYKGIPASGIRLHAVADKTDPLVADFGAQLDAMLKVNHPEISWQENYLGKTFATAPEVTAAMKDAANGGADLILYSGHGNAARLGATAPRILDQTSVQDWTGNTVFIQATCTANWMAKNEQDYKSIAIQALTQPQGGISASIGTSTYMNPDVATAFMNQLLKNASGSNARWGSVLMKTQQWAGNQSGSAFYKDLMNTEQLFGDPAMHVFTSKPSAPSNSSSSSAAGTF